MTVIIEDNYLRAGARPSILRWAGNLPASVQHPDDVYQARFVDDAALRIQELVGRKGWDISWLDVHFKIEDDIRPKYQVNKIVGTIPGQCWSIEFGRRNSDGLCVLPARIKVPEHELEVCEDGRATYYRYVGDNWEQDEEEFMYERKHDAKKNNMPRTYLKYSRDTKGVFYNDNDGDREYDAIEGEPLKIDEITVLCDMAVFLDQVIAKLEAMPDDPKPAEEKWRIYAQQEKTEIRNPVPALIAVTLGGGYGDLVLKTGYDVFCIFTSGGDVEFPVSDIATRGFTYGFANAPYCSESKRWGKDLTAKDAHVYQVNLKYENDIYVADEAPYLSARAYYSSVAEDENRATNADEINEMCQVAAKTIIPLSKYHDDYKKPIYLIARPLWADEARDITQDVRNNMDSSINEASYEYKTHMIETVENMLKPK